MFRREEYITAITLFFCLCILASLAYGAKSVFVISAQDYSVVKPYRIHPHDANDANYITLQGTTALPQKGKGAIALAAWPQKELL